MIVDNDVIHSVVIDMFPHQIHIEKPDDLLDAEEWCWAELGEDALNMTDAGYWTVNKNSLWTAWDRTLLFKHEKDLLFMKLSL